MFKEHTFAICAYKESDFLEECILSVINQTVKSNIIMVTSTKNEYISNLAAKYNIEVYYRDGKPDIQEDWNFAIEKANTKFVTIAHQDDIYFKTYVEELEKNINENNDIIIFTDYVEIKNGEIIPKTNNLKIKETMLLPLRLNVLKGNKFIRKRILSLGSPICCPAVTYNKQLIGDKIFTSNMKCSLDWDTWYKLSKYKGRFVYINKDLMAHRIHEESETSVSIANNVRQNEDYEMFRKFWPKRIAKLLTKVYSKSLETNKIEK